MAALAKRCALSRKAADDLDAIYKYGLEQWGPRQAERYQDALFDAFMELGAGVKRGRPLFDSYLKLLVGAHLVIFREDEATIYITRILHGRMDLRRHL